MPISIDFAIVLFVAIILSLNFVLILSYSETGGDATHEPSALLRDDVGVHAATVIMGAKKVVDVECDSDGTEGIITANAEYETGWYLLATDNLSGRSDCILPGCSSLLKPKSRFLYHL